MTQWWLVYVRWATGRRETICTAFPDELVDTDARFTVLAVMAMPRVTVLEGKYDARRQ